MKDPDFNWLTSKPIREELLAQLIVSPTGPLCVEEVSYRNASLSINEVAEVLLGLYERGFIEAIQTDITNQNAPDVFYYATQKARIALRKSGKATEYEQLQSKYEMMGKTEKILQIEYLKEKHDIFAQIKTREFAYHF